MVSWDIFPFEPADLTLVPLVAPVLPEPAREGVGGAGCRSCSSEDGTVWSDDHWRLTVGRVTSGVPLRLMLVSRAHVDYPDLDDDRAAELGVLLVHLARAIESLPHVARAHVHRWGDGAEHLHVFAYARPEGMQQLRGIFLPVWDDALPAVPTPERDADALAVAHALARSYGGAVVEDRLVG